MSKNKGNSAPKQQTEKQRKAAEKRAATIAAKKAAAEKAAAEQPLVINPQAIQAQPEPPKEEFEIIPARPNRLVLSLVQDTEKEVTKTINGVKQKVMKPVYHLMEWSVETMEAMSSEAIAVWLIAKLAEYQLLQKNMGKACFDQSLAIMVNITVNDIQALHGLKFTTNPKALERIFRENRGLIARAFNPTVTAFSNSEEGIKASMKATHSLLAGELNYQIAGVPQETKVPKQLVINEGGQLVNDVVKNEEELIAQ